MIGQRSPMSFGVPGRLPGHSGWCRTCDSSSNGGVVSQGGGQVAVGGGLGKEVPGLARWLQPRQLRPRSATVARPVLRAGQSASASLLGSPPCSPFMLCQAATVCSGPLGVVVGRGLGVVRGLRSEQLSAEEARLDEHRADAERRDLRGQRLYPALHPELGGCVARCRLPGPRCRQSRRSPRLALIVGRA